LYKIFFYSDDNKQQKKWGFISCFCIFISGFIHIYYVPMLAVLGVSFYGFRSILSFKRTIFIHSALHIFFTVLSVFVCIKTIGLLDTYSSIRPQSAEGYDWLNWKLRPENLFMRTSRFKVPFIYNYKKIIDAETNAYLGAFALYAAFLIPVYLYFKQKLNWTKNNFIIILSLSGLVLFSIALGEAIFITEKDIIFTNYLNPFFYLHKITDIVTHFRGLGRFGWVFFITFNVAMLFICDRLLDIKRLKLIIAILVSFLAIDAYSTIRYYKNSTAGISVFLPEQTQTVKYILSDIDFKKYQCILYLPFFHVGSENYDYTIDPDEKSCIEALQLSYISRLPLMNSKMSRTPQVHAQSLLEFLSSGKIDKNLKSSLNDKEILVVVNYSLLENGYKPSNISALDFYNKQTNFLVYKKIQLLKKYKEYSVFSMKM
jgi:hypothetical protein